MSPLGCFAMRAEAKGQLAPVPTTYEVGLMSLNDLVTWWNN